MKKNNSFFKSRKGNAFVFILILAIIVAVFSVYMSYYLSNMKPPKPESITTLISSDYQMESAVIMQMQKYKTNKQNEPKSIDKEFLPGINLSVKCSKNQKDEFVFETTVSGNNYVRKLKIKADKDIPDKLEFLE